MAELILALDLPSSRDALRVLDQVPQLRWVKVGSVLMTREGGTLLRMLSDRGLQIFLDLKWHDIPNTVAGAVKAARDHGVSLATVHSLGGRTMMEAAAHAAGPGLRLVGVTVLTSHDDTTYAEAIGRDAVHTRSEVLRLATSAHACGLAGVVCSPLEISDVRRALGPEALVVVPGIRQAGDSANDQQRTATAEAAVQAGASHLVVGRPILDAKEPGEVVERLLKAVS
jgi:orotidine-5'-phosphate decarboxylase